MHLPHHRLPLYLVTLLAILHLAVALTTWESIHQTLNTYPLAIDTKDFDLFSKVISNLKSAKPPPLLPGNEIITHLHYLLPHPNFRTVLYPIESQVMTATGLRSRRIRQLHRSRLQPDRPTSDQILPCRNRRKRQQPAPPWHHPHRYPP